MMSSQACETFRPARCRVSQRASFTVAARRFYTHLTPVSESTPYAQDCLELFQVYINESHTLTFSSESSAVRCQSQRTIGPQQQQTFPFPKPFHPLFVCTFETLSHSFSELEAVPKFR